MPNLHFLPVNLSSKDNPNMVKVGCNTNSVRLDDGWYLEFLTFLKLHRNEIWSNSSYLTVIVLHYKDQEVNYFQECLNLLDTIPQFQNVFIQNVNHFSYDLLNSTSCWLKTSSWLLSILFAVCWWCLHANGRATWNYRSNSESHPVQDVKIDHVPHWNNCTRIKAFRSCPCMSCYPRLLDLNNGACCHRLLLGLVVFIIGAKMSSVATMVVERLSYCIFMWWSKIFNSFSTSISGRRKCFFAEICELCFCLMIIPFGLFSFCSTKERENIHMMYNNNHCWKYVVIIIYPSTPRLLYPSTTKSKSLCKM